MALLPDRNVNTAPLSETASGGLLGIEDEKLVLLKDLLGPAKANADRAEVQASRAETAADNAAALAAASAAVAAEALITPMVAEAEIAKNLAAASAEAAATSAARVDLGELDAAVQLSIASSEDANLSKLAAENALSSTLLAADAAQLDRQEAASVVSGVVAMAWSARTMIVEGAPGLVMASLDPAAGNVWLGSNRASPALEAGNRIGSVAMISNAGIVYAEQSVANDRPYLGRYPEGGRRNLLLNSGADGAVIGAPGTMPSTWGTAGTGVTREVVGIGLDEEDNPYIDLRIYGVLSSNGIINFSGNTNLAVATGERYTWGLKVQRVAGTSDNVNDIRLQIGWRTAADAFLSVSVYNDVNMKDATEAVLASFYADVPVDAAYCIPQLRLNCSGSVDFTLRLSLAQFERGEARTHWQKTMRDGLYCTESGKPSIWYLHQKNSNEELIVTLPSGGQATLLKANEGGSEVLPDVTLSSGSYGLLAQAGTKLCGFAAILRVLDNSERTLAPLWLERMRGNPVMPEISKASGRPVSLYELGFTPASGDLRVLVEKAAAVANGRGVYIPFSVAPWVSNGRWDINGIYVEFALGARLAQNHAVVPGIRLLNAAHLHRPYVTSTVYNVPNLAGADPIAASITHTHGARSLWMQDENCKVTEVQMLEYMAGGIQINGKGCKVSNLTARFLRSHRGWAAAANCKPGSDHSIVGVNHIFDCDRALEPEDGASFIKFYKDGAGVIEKCWSRWYDAASGVTAGEETFIVSVHSHVDAIYKACEGITYDDLTVIDCVSAVLFTEANAMEDKWPRDCHVRRLTVINTSAFPSTRQGSRPQVVIDGHGCSVDVKFLSDEASPQITANCRIAKGTGNKIKLRGPEIKCSVPWVDVALTATGSQVEVEATRQAYQPPAGADAGADHLLNIRGPKTRIYAKIHGVERRGYVRLDGNARGSVVVAPDFIMPVANAPAAAIRFNGCDYCQVFGGQFEDVSGLTQFARFINGSTRNLLYGVVAEKSSGVAVSIDPGANDNAIINNIFGAATINNGGIGNVIAPNF